MKKINFSFTNNEKPKKGSVLISYPFLNDPYFGRSVVILCEHNENGTFGFVLNNFTEIDLHKIDSNFPDINAKIGFGGPVSKDSLFFIHSLGSKIANSLQIRNNLFYGGDFDQICSVLENTPDARKKIRFFIGYSGWDFEQLNAELRENSWITVNNLEDKLILDSNHEDLWKTALEMQQGKFKMISKFPNNPNDN
tara:strand:+ start:17787 stop:18371 length:585 start_codon:yes stop_codon:yes gene_type:complete